MIAEANGIFTSIGGCCPFLNFTRGVLRTTFSGIHSFVVKLGKSKYSLKVRLASEKK